MTPQLCLVPFSPSIVSTFLPLFRDWKLEDRKSKGRFRNIGKVIENTLWSGLNQKFTVFFLSYIAVALKDKDRHSDQRRRTVERGFKSIVQISFVRSKYMEI